MITPPTIPPPPAKIETDPKAELMRLVDPMVLSRDVYADVCKSLLWSTVGILGAMVQHGTPQEKEFATAVLLEITNAAKERI